MAANVRATQLRKTDVETESTNSGRSSLSNRSSASHGENQSILATPMAEQSPEIRPLLEKAVALVGEGAWSRRTGQRYCAASGVIQPARIESLSFMQPQEMYTKLQPPPPPQTLRECRLQGS